MRTIIGERRSREGEGLASFLGRMTFGGRYQEEARKWFGMRSGMPGLGESGTMERHQLEETRRLAKMAISNGMTDSSLLEEFESKLKEEVYGALL